MEAGYSIIKNKYIKADECDYKSTRDLQIRCPFCLDPLFLKKGLHNASHFSHYSISLTAKECELRSSSYNFFNTAIDSSESKGQEIEKHYVVFANCYALFIGIPTNVNLNKSQYSNLELYDSVIKYAETQIDRIDSIVIPKNYLPIFVQRSILFFLYKLDIEDLISKKNISEIREEYLNTIINFFNLFESKQFDFTLSGLDYRKNNKFYDNKKDSANEVVSSKKDKIEELLQVKFSKAEAHLILKIFSINKKDPTLCLGTKDVLSLAITPFDCDESKKISLKKIYYFLGQDNIFFFQKKEIGAIWIGLIKEFDDFYDRLALINSFSEKTQKDNIFYKLFPIYTKKMPLYFGEYKQTKKQCLSFIEKEKQNPDKC